MDEVIFLSYRPIVEWPNTTDSKSVDPGFESQSGELLALRDFSTVSILARYKKVGGE